MAQKCLFLNSYGRDMRMKAMKPLYKYYYIQRNIKACASYGFIIT